MTQRKLYLGPLTDNRRWDRLAIRPDDVIVVTPAGPVKARDMWRRPPSERWNRQAIMDIVATPCPQPKTKGN